MTFISHPIKKEKINGQWLIQFLKVKIIRIFKGNIYSCQWNIRNKRINTRTKRFKDSNEFRTRKTTNENNFFPVIDRTKIIQDGISFMIIVI